MNLYRNGEFVEMYNSDREFHLLLEYLDAHLEPKGAGEAVQEVVTAPVPVSTEQAAAPTPTPSPTTEHPAVQSPPNPSGAVVSLDVQTFDTFLAQGPAFIKFFAPW